MKRARTILSVLLAILLLASCLPMSVWAAEDATDEPIESAFTDPLFLREVRKLVGKTNGEHIYRSDVENITKLEVNDIADPNEKFKYLESLQGIEYFTGLKELSCYFNDIQELDLSHNTKLEIVDCSYNDLLVSLDVTNCPELWLLDCNNTGLPSLDVSKNPKLKILLTYEAELTALDVSHNPLLEKLDAWGGHLVTLDVSNNRKLTYLDCMFHDMCTVESIIGLENCTELEEENFWFEPQNTVRTGHDWDDGAITTQPDCTEKGERTYTCINCKMTKTEEIAAVGHEWGDGAITTQPDCTERGERTYTCINCKMTKTEEIAAAGHEWGGWVITAKPSLTATGTAEHVCAKDESHKESVTLPVLSDTTVWTKGEIVDGAQEYHSIYGTVTVAVSSPPPAPTLPAPEPETPVCPQDSTCPIAKFTDTSVTGWYHDAVHYALEHGLMSGTGSTTFEPDSTLSRAMLVQILYNLEGKPTIIGSTIFDDVSASAWYADAVAWAAANGVVAGNGDGTFSPEDPVTREQMAVIFRNYARYVGRLNVHIIGDISGFTDAGKLSDWAISAMQWAVGSGLISGKGNGVLDPVGNSTRAEAATVLMKFCEGS